MARKTVPPTPEPSLDTLRNRSMQKPAALMVGGHEAPTICVQLVPTMGARTSNRGEVSSQLQMVKRLARGFHEMQTRRTTPGLRHAYVC